MMKTRNLSTILKICFSTKSPIFLDKKPNARLWKTKTELFIFILELLFPNRKTHAFSNTRTWHEHEMQSRRCIFLQIPLYSSSKVLLELAGWLACTSTFKLMDLLLCGFHLLLSSGGRVLRPNSSACIWTRTLDFKQGRIHSTFSLANNLKLKLLSQFFYSGKGARIFLYMISVQVH